MQAEPRGLTHLDRITALEEIVKRLRMELDYTMSAVNTISDETGATNTLNDPRERN